MVFWGWILVDVDMLINDLFEILQERSAVVGGGAGTPRHPDPAVGHPDEGEARVGGAGRGGLRLLEPGDQGVMARDLDHGPGGRQGRQVVYHVRLVKTIEKHESLLFYFKLFILLLLLPILLIFRVDFR